MQISVVTSVPYPRPQVYAAMRDEMCDLGEYMPNIASITIVSREDSGSETRLVNRWQAAKTEIPAAARGFVKPEQVYWIDHAEWLGDTWRCNWNLEMGFMPERIQVTGATTYHEVEGGTEMRIEGTLSIDLKGLLPRLVTKSLTPKVEGFVVRMVEPNFQKTADALCAFLDAQKA